MHLSTTRHSDSLHPTQTALSCLWGVPREDPHIYILFGVVLYMLLWFAATTSARHGHGVTTPNEVSRLGEGGGYSTDGASSATSGNKIMSDKGV